MVQGVQKMDMPSLQEVYGTPYFLEASELRTPADAQLAGHDAELRDVFLFQCLTGCRVSDLMRLTRDNVDGQCIRYIPEDFRRGTQP